MITMKKKMTKQEREELLKQLHEDNDAKIDKLLEERYPYMRIRMERATPKSWANENIPQLN